MAPHYPPEELNTDRFIDDDGSRGRIAHCAIELAGPAPHSGARTSNATAVWTFLNSRLLRGRHRLIRSACHIRRAIVPLSQCCARRNPVAKFKS